MTDNKIIFSWISQIDIFISKYLTIGIFISENRLEHFLYDCWICNSKDLPQDYQMIGDDVIYSEILVQFAIIVVSLLLFTIISLTNISSGDDQKMYSQCTISARTYFC